MMKFAELAAPFFDTAEIIELHHDDKVDAPSGTAIATAERMAEASSDWAPDPTTKTVLEGARGGKGAAASRSTRCGCVGSSRTRRCCSAPPGRRLSIRQDSYDRTSYMPGVVRAVKAVGRSPASRSGSTRSSGCDRVVTGSWSPDESRERVLAGTYECVARVGIGKTTVEDVTRPSRVSHGHHLPALSRWPRRAPPRHRRMGDGPVLRPRSRRRGAGEAPTSRPSSSAPCRSPAMPCSRSTCSRRCSNGTGKVDAAHHGRAAPRAGVHHRLLPPAALLTTRLPA